MWKFYDRIINQIPDDLDACIDYIHVGPMWTIVTAGKYAGIAVTVNEQNKQIPDMNHLLHMPLKEAAAFCKSWDFIKASFGTAALNAYVNSPENTAARICKNDTNGFDDYRKLAAGKKVGIVGHFINLERFLLDSDVYVLERRPEPGDYPDPACEYILPEMDYTFITGSAFINKTLPRLIHLSKYPIIIGPSFPMSSLLFQYGVQELNGYMPLTITAKNAPAIGSGQIHFSRFGKKVKIKYPCKRYDDISFRHAKL